MSLSNVAYHLLRSVRAPALARRLHSGAAVFCYHNVTDTATSQVPANGAHLAAERFAWQAAWIAQRFEVIPLRELIARLDAGRSVRGVAALTFDDAYRGFVSYALPTLRKLKLPATVFVVSDMATAPRGFWWDHPATTGQTDAARERWFSQLQGDREAILRDAGADPAWHPESDLLPLDWAGIRAALGADLDIGGHSATHRALTTLSDRDLAAELAASRSVIGNALQRQPAVFAYPYGRWNDRVRAAVQSAGYEGAVTLDYGFPRSGSDRWSLRRINIPATISEDAFEAWASGLHLRELLS